MGFAIVVDVSVARCAGTSGKPEPEACRRALAAIRDYGHRVAMSPEVYSEWRKTFITSVGISRPYPSEISIRWLTDMQSKGRVIKVVIDSCSELRKRALNGLLKNNRFNSSTGPVNKDFHLVETALKSDNRVLSIDQKMFNHLRNLLTVAQEVCKVMWVNPMKDPAEEWLIEGAPDTIKYHVC